MAVTIPLVQPHRLYTNLFNESYNYPVDTEAYVKSLKVLGAVCVYSFMHICMCIYMCVQVYMYAWGRAEVNLDCSSSGAIHLFFEMGPLIGLELTDKTRLAVQHAPGTCC